MRYAAHGATLMLTEVKTMKRTLRLGEEILDAVPSICSERALRPSAPP